MYRTSLSAGVLVLIVASLSGAQSPRRSSDCRTKSANCDRSYFDYLVASTGAIAFDFFLLSLDGSEKRTSKRQVFGSVAGAPADRASAGEVVPSDWRTEFARDDKLTTARVETPRFSSSRDDLEQTNTLALFAWDWMQSLRRAQNSELADGGAKSRDIPSAGDDRRVIDSPKRGRENDKGEPAPGKGETREAPRHPDVGKDLDGDLTPEPSTLLLIGSSLPFAFALVRRRKRR